MVTDTADVVVEQAVEAGGPVLKLGDKFSSYEQLNNKIKEYEKANFVQLWKRESRTINAAKKGEVQTVDSTGLDWTGLLG